MKGHTEKKKWKKGAKKETDEEGKKEKRNWATQILLTESIA